MKDYFAGQLKQLRKQKEMSQEQLAQALDVTVQAVSKWECSLSYPDIETLLALSDLLEVTVDGLLRDSVSSDSHKLPDDNTLRVVQYIGNHMIRQDDPLSHSPIPLTLPYDTEDNSPSSVHIEIWGSAEIDGDVCGHVNAGSGINCGDVSGNATAGGSIACGDVGGNATAGDSINCGDVGSNAEAGADMACGDVGGNAEAGNTISCGDVGGNAEAANSINCGDIGGSAYAGNRIN